MSKHLTLATLLLPILICIGCASEEVQSVNTAPLTDGNIELVTVATLSDPWGMSFLPGGDMLITEQAGKLVRLDPISGDSTPVSGVPESKKIGQGGLLDVLVGPHSAGPQPWIYLSYVIEGEGGYTTRVARGHLRDTVFEDVEVLFTAEPYFPTKRHFGSRLLIDEGYLFLTVGDRGQRQYAQDLSTNNGKVMRIFTDGTIPTDNPFVNKPGARPEVYSYGHRNPQGLARNPLDGSLWVSEHGPQGGDELNRIEPGHNYGWPVITYGEEYGGGKIGIGTEREGMEQPVKYYLPSIGTGGIAFYTAERYPDWKPSLLVAALRYTHINRVELSGAGLGEEFRLFGDSKMRFRDVAVGPAGFVYALAGDRLVKLVPVAAAGP